MLICERISYNDSNKEMINSSNRISDEKVNLFKIIFF